MSYPTPVRGIYLRKQTIEEISGGVSGAVSLPLGNVIPPGKYIVLGTSWDMSAEGLYVVTDFNGRCTQVISYSSDLEALLSGICYLLQQGTDDNSLTVAQMLTTALSRKLVMTCGISSKFAQAILAQAGIQCRLVGGLAGSGYNGYDDGHLAIEIYVGGKWAYVDIDNGQSVWVSSIGSTRATLLDVHLNLSSIVFDPLTTGMQAEVINYSQFPFLEAYQRSNLSTWYGRVFQVPYQIVGSVNYFYNDDSTYAANAVTYSAAFSPLSTTAFAANFYGNNGSTHFLSSGDTMTGFGATTYTWFDNGNPIINGKTVASIGVEFSAGVSSVVPLVGQKNADGTISVVATGAGGSHPGNGWDDFALSSSYAVPASGTYLAGYVAGNVGTNLFTSRGSRARYTGAMTNSNNAVTYYTDGTLPIRWNEN